MAKKVWVVTAGAGAGKTINKAMGSHVLQKMTSREGAVAVFGNWIRKPKTCRASIIECYGDVDDVDYEECEIARYFNGSAQ